ncbi:MAG: nucleotidyltransferase [Candidatus Limivivens sp.]|nr:nucleotidyltransferase [Candidatus Limivivens sp.]
MKNTTLVIMAAGIGSRFGGGIKQLEPVGPNGEIIMDYSIHDALEAGFNRIVFIIRRDLEKDFREIIGNRIEKVADVAYAFQEIDDLPSGFTRPEGRKKPWGTGQAILSCKGIVDTPFAVINADDYYGKEGFAKIHDFLVNEAPEDGVSHYCMAGFILGNTLSENGVVTRGVCRVNEEGNLAGVTETHDISKTESGAAVPDGKGGLQPLDPASLVSMNMWGFTPDILDVLETGFREFLASLPEGDIKSEYLIPTVVDDLLKAGKATVTVLKSHDKWFGVTYKEDKESVVNSFRQLIDAGVYKTPLYS